MVCSQAVYSQRKKPRLSTLEFGAGPSMVSVFDNESKTDWRPKLSGAAGIGLVYPIKRNLSITAHTMIERKGGKVTDRTRDAEFDIEDFNITSTYISFTPGIRRYLGDAGFFIEGGVYVAFLLDSKMSPVVTVMRPPTTGPFAAIDAGVSGAIGVTPYRTKLKGWNFRLVNNLGLSDANLQTGTKESSNSLSLIVGMRMRMR
jgi:hypothetical protein